MGRMSAIARLFPIFITVFVSYVGRRGAAAEPYEKCAIAIKAWGSREMELIAAGDKQRQETPELKPLLFFLHIPRTGGRTYHQCFLKALYPPNQRCPRSYDTLRLDTSNPSCRLLSTHDDYSLMTKLPETATSIVTNVRDPADRLMSAYEFMVELSARTLRPNSPNEQVTREGLIEARKRATDKQRTETRNVWPWSHLVPMMEDDLWERRDAAMTPEGRMRFVLDRGPFDTPRVTMPLNEFVHHPLVKDLIHNGGTLQVAGLTNNSCLPEATFLRHCVFEHTDLGSHVLEVAKGRLERMLYVGLTEKHKDSAKLFATIIDRPLSSAAHVMQLNPMHKGVVPTRERAIAIAKAHLQQNNNGGGRRLQAIPTWDGRGGWKQEGGQDAGMGWGRLRRSRQEGGVERRNLMEVARMKPRKRRAAVEQVSNSTKADEVAQATGMSLLAHYMRCVEQQRTKYLFRRDQALKNIAPIKFSKDLRLLIPADLLEEVRSMSWLDMELLEFGRKLFAKQQAHYKDKLDAMTDDPEVQPGPSMKEIVAQQQALAAAQARASETLLSTPDITQTIEPNSGQSDLGGHAQQEGTTGQEPSQIKEGDLKALRESVGKGALVLEPGGGVGGYVVGSEDVENKGRQRGWLWSRRRWGSAVGVGVVTLLGCVVVAARRRQQRRKGPRAK